MSTETYPYLAHLLGGYFHQDAYDAGETDEDIVRDFINTSWDYEPLGVRADIKRLLHLHEDQLLDVVQQTFKPALVIGHTDAEVRAWLLKIEGLLDQPGHSND